MPDKEKVIDALKNCLDPELHLDVWTLGLIYNLDIDEGKVSIKLTFTTPFCPYGPMLLEDIEQKVREVEGVKDVSLEVVFDPPWQPSEELKAMLGV